MRLIDADSLEVALHNFFDGKVINEPAYILRDVFCHIDNAPTVEERTQGEWVLMYCSCGDRYYTCSICNRAIEVKNGQSLKDYPYCHCGASMKGGTE